MTSPDYPTHAVHSVRKLVFMYLAKGTAEADNPQGHPPGERHEMLIFLAGYRNDYAWDEAERVANEQHWVDIEFGKAGRVAPEQIAEQDATVRESYRQALEDGSAVVVYAPIAGTDDA